MPIDICWTGVAPPLGVRAAVEADPEIRVVTDASVAEIVLCVTEGGAPPPPPASGSPFIWVGPPGLSAAAIGAAVEAGAYDVVAGADERDLGARLRARCAELRVESICPPDAPGMIAGSAASLRLCAEVALAARTSMPVLLTGETGTGKEVCAQLLHAWSARRERAFVPINCAAIPNEMLEAELFGHVKGAFSGAVRSYDGQLAAAEGGTVFLDEVDDTPLSFQVKLLRVLEDRVVRRIGETAPREVDFRILAATNRDLRTLVARGAFGADLFERLAIVSIRLPPLRERREDVPALAMHMIRRFYDEEPAAVAHHEVREVTPEALAALEAYAWPGNIRELRNVVWSALVRKRAGHALLVSDLPVRLLRRGAGGGEERDEVDVDVVQAGAVAAAIDAGRFNLRDCLERLERLALGAALERTGGNAAAAAGLLGEVGRGESSDPGATVRAMMRRLGIEGPAAATLARSRTRRRAAETKAKAT